MQTASISIAKTKIEKEGGVVILSLKEYRELSARAVPTYQLHGKEAVALDRLVTKGLKEYAAGKCKTIRSLADLD